MAEEIQGQPIMKLPKPTEYYRLTTLLHEAQSSLKRKRNAESVNQQRTEIERLERQLKNFS